MLCSDWTIKYLTIVIKSTTGYPLLKFITYSSLSCTVGRKERQLIILVSFMYRLIILYFLICTVQSIISLRCLVVKKPAVLVPQPRGSVGYRFI